MQIGTLIFQNENEYSFLKIIYFAAREMNE